jgi:hypothetical protein
MKQEDVERIATEYVESTGVAPCVLDGSEFDDKENPPIWRVYFSFCKTTEQEEAEIGLPWSLTIHVSDLTGAASHIAHL